MAGQQPNTAAGNQDGERGTSGKDKTMPPAKPTAAPSFTRLLAIAAVIEAFLLALVAVAPIGGVSQTISPLARAWPWLLAPARLIFGNSLVDSSIPPERGWPSLALFAVLLVGASCAAALVIPLCRRFPGADRRYLALALGAAAVLGLTFVLLPSLPSDDIFSYILYGRIGALHHANPLIVTPASFPQDPFLRLVFWQGTRSVYGPAWLLLSGGLTLLAEACGGALATYVLLFKLLGFAAHLANAALIWLILGRIAPRRQLLGTLLYAWNPLCLLEFCASAHNDAIMLTFALLGVYCLVRGWEWPALVSFGLSISIKYVLLALLPLYLALVVRQALMRSPHPQPLPRARERGAQNILTPSPSPARRGEPENLTPDSWKQAALAVLWRAAVVLGVVAVTALPYWAGPQTLGSILYSPPAQQLDNSLLDAVSWPLRSLAQALGLGRATAASMVESALKIIGLLGFLALWCWQLWRVYKEGTLAVMLRGWAWVLLGYALIASGWYWPWYATWAVAFVALAAPTPNPSPVRGRVEPGDLTPDPSPIGEGSAERLMIAALLLAGGSLTLYAFLPLYAAPIYGYRAFLALGPAAAYLLVRGWQCWRTYKNDSAPAKR